MAAEERDRILGLLEAGKISADQAAVLLDAVAGGGLVDRVARAVGGFKFHRHSPERGDQCLRCR